MRLKLVLDSPTQTLEQWITLPLSSVPLAIFCQRTLRNSMRTGFFMLYSQKTADN